MSYKKYIRRNGKVFGPYVYHSRKVNGKVITEYEGKYKKENGKFSMLPFRKKKKNFIFWSLLSVFVLISFIGFSGTVTEISPENIIKIISAEHLNHEKIFVSDIYNQVKELDGIWSEPIDDNEYARVTFEKKLTSSNDITIYPRIISGNPSIEVYEKNKDEKIAEFTSLKSNEYNKVLLTNLGKSRVVLNENKEKISEPFFVNSIMMVKVKKDGGIVFYLKDENKTSNLDSLKITQVVPKIFEMLNASPVKPGNLSYFVLEDPEKSRIFALEFPNNSFNSGNVNFHNELQNLLNSSTENNEDDSLVFAFNFSTYSSLNSNSSTGYQSILSQNSWSSSDNIPVFINLSNMSRFINLTTLWAINSESNFIELINSSSMEEIDKLNYINLSSNARNDLGEFDLTGAFWSGNSEGYSQDTFDLKVVGGTIQLDYVVDPSTILYGGPSSNLVYNGTLNDNLLAVNIMTRMNVNDYSLINSTNGLPIFLPPGASTSADTFVSVNYTNIPAGFTSINISTVHNLSITTSARTGIALWNWTSGDWRDVVNTSSTAALTMKSYNITQSRLDDFVSGSEMRVMIFDDSGSSSQLGVDSILVNVTYITPTDNTLPAISIVFPTANNTNSSNTNLDVNYTASDAGGLFNCWYTNDTNLVNTSLATCGTNITTVVWDEGKHNVTVYANDTAGNVNQSRISFTIDTIQPTISIASPSNNTNTTDTLLDITYIPTDAGSGLFNFWYNNDTYSAANKSLGVLGTSFNITNITWGQGKHNVTIWANDSAGNVNFASVSFTIDITNPIVTITNPISNNTNSSDNLLDVNYIPTDTFTQIGSVWYTNNSGNINKSLGSGGTFTNITNITWGEGKHNVTIYANDTVGNVNFASVSFTIDTTNPTISIASPSNNTNSSDNLLDVLYIPTDAGSGLFNFWYNNDTYTAANKSLGVLGTSFNITNLTWSQGKHNVTIWANDSAGNYNFASVSFTIDSTAPTVSIQIPETNNTNTTNINQNINFTFSDSTGIDSVWYANDTFSVANKSLGSAGTYFNITNLTWGQGKHNVTVYVNDSAGNVAFQTTSFIVDTTQPTISIDSLTNNTNTTDTLLDITYIPTDSGSGLFNCWYTNDTYSANTSLATCGTNITTVTWSSGKHNVTIYANDTVGNVNFASVSFTIDTTQPTISIASPSNNTNTTDTLLDITYIPTDAGSGLFNFWYNNDTYSAANKSLGVLGTSFNITNLTWGEGNHNVTIWANDSAGNVNFASVSFTIDTTVPAVQFVDLTSSTGNQSSTIIFANVTASDSTGLSGINITLYNSTNLINSSFSATSPFFFNFTGLPDGKYFINATANDSLNNKNLTETRTIRIDTTNPTISIASPSNNTNSSNTNLDVNFIASDAGSGLFNCWYTNDTYSANTSLATCGTNITTATWSEGKHNVTIWANDSAGNVNFASVSFTVDSINPLLEFVAPTEANASSKTQNYIFVNVSVTEINFVNITYRLYNSTGEVNTTTYSTLITTINWTDLNNNGILYRYNVTVFDISENSNKSETREITLNSNTVPDVSITYPLNASYSINVSQLNYTIVDDGVLNNCWYTLNNGVTNVTITCGQNVTDLTSTEGSNTWRVYANDSGELQNSSSVTFFKDTVVPNADFVSLTTATGNYSKNSIDANVTATDSGSGLSQINITLWNSTRGIYQSNFSATSPLFINFTSLPDGTYYLNATVSDSLGNRNFTETRTIILDTSGPTVSIQVPPINNTNTTNTLQNINFTFSDSNGVDSIWFINDTYSAANRSLGSGGIYFNITNLTWSSGKHNVTIYVNDTSGNVAFQTTSFTIDTTQPTISIASPSNNTNSSNTNLDVNFIASDAGSGLFNCWYSNDTYSANTSLATCGTNITTATWSEGKHNVTIYANDTVGNVNFASVSFTIDTTQPTISIAFPSNNTNSSNMNLNVNFTASDATLFNFWYSNDTYSINRSLGVLGTSFNITNMTWGQGKHNVTVYANDSFGNVNFASVSFTIDTTGPAVQFVAPTSSSGNRTQNSIDANITASDSFIELSGINIFVFYSNSSLYNSTFSATFSLYLNFTGLADGTYLFNATANDSLNNKNSTETRSITVDTTSPAIQFVPITESNNSQLTRNNIHVNVTASDGVKLNGINISLYNTTGIVNSTFSTASQLFLNFTGLADDIYYFNASANDTAGNVNFTDTRTATIDTGAPTVSFISPTESSGIFKKQSNANVNVSASDPNLNRITIRLYDSAHSLLNTSISSTSPFFLNFTGLSDGQYFYNATANDTIGNPANTETRNITLDTINPSITSVTENPSDPVTYVSADIYEFNATVTDTNLGFVLFEFNGTNYTIVNSVGDVFNFTISGLSAGTYPYKWFANDSAQNTNTSSGTYTISVASGAVFTYVNHTRANITIGQGVSIYLNGTIENGTGDIKLYNNGILINQGVSPLSNFTTFNSGGSFNITTIYEGNANFSSDYETFFVTVTDNINPDINITSPNNISHTSIQTKLNYSASDNSALSSCWYTLNNGITNVTITCGQNATGLTSNQGSNTWRVYTNDTSNNLNSSSVTFFVDSFGPVTQFVDLTSSSGNQSHSAIWANVTASDTTSSLTWINISLYNSTGIVNSLFSATSPLFVNFTGLADGTYLFNATANDTLNNKNSTETRGITIDTTFPQISVSSPSNGTTTSDTGLDVLYLVSDLNLNSCWYSNDSFGINTTITCGTNITSVVWSEGSHNVRIYANDSANNLNQTSVTFTIDTSLPSISFESPTETSDATLGRNNIQVNVTATDDNLANITIILFNSTHDALRTNVSSTSPYFINYTGLSAGIYYFNATATDTTNSKTSTETRNVNLSAPTLNISNPKNNTYLTNVSLQLSFISSLADSIWYNLDNLANATITGNITFNASQGSHTLNLFANNSVGEITANVTFFVNSSKFTIIYGEFHGDNEGDSPDLNESTYEDLQNYSGLILENNNSGKISFNENINLIDTDDDGNSEEHTEDDLDSHINISSNRIEINSTVLKNLNKSATLSLYGLAFTDPRILRDGSVCPSSICTEQSYSGGGTFVFNVTSFSVYSLEETPSTVADTPGQQGGGSSSAGTGSVVSVAECIQDNQCGADEICWDFKCAKLFDIKIVEFESPAKLGDFFDFTYFLKGMAKINSDVKINFWIEKDGQRATSGSDTLYIGNFEEKTETTKIFLPSGLDSGVYEFHVQVVHPSYKTESSRIIEISVKGGVATINQAEPIQIKQIVIYTLFIFAMLFVLMIFYLERRKVANSFYRPEIKWSKKHKISILVFLIFVIAGTIFYLTGLLNFIVDALANAFLWVKLNLAQYALFMAILALFILMIGLIAVVFKKKHFDFAKDRFRLFRVRKQLETKYYQNVENAHPLYKPEINNLGKFARSFVSEAKEIIYYFDLKLRKVLGLIKIKFDSLTATKESIDSGTKGAGRIGKELVQEIENHYLEATGKIKEIAKDEILPGERNIGEKLVAAGRISRQSWTRLKNMFDLREKVKNGGNIAEHHATNILNNSKNALREISLRVARKVEHGAESLKEDLKTLERRASYRFGRRNENAKEDVKNVLKKTSPKIGNLADSAENNIKKLGVGMSSQAKEYAENLKTGKNTLFRKIRNLFAGAKENSNRNLNATRRDIQNTTKNIIADTSSIINYGKNKTSSEIGKLTSSIDGGVRDLSRAIKNPIVKEIEELNRDTGRDIRVIGNLPGKLIRINAKKTGDYSETKHSISSFFGRIGSFFNSRGRKERKKTVAQLVDVARKIEEARKGTEKTVEELIDEAKGMDDNKDKKGGLETY